MKALQSVKMLLSQSVSAVLYALSRGRETSVRVYLARGNNGKGVICSSFPPSFSFFNCQKSFEFIANETLVTLEECGFAPETFLCGLWRMISSQDHHPALK